LNLGSVFSHFLRDFINIPLIRRIYERILWNHIKNGDKPDHVGIILDGNRRWASTHGFPSSVGHNFGAEKVEALLNWCMDLGIKILTIYVFSTENFDRQHNEVNEIMDLLRTKLEDVLYDTRIDDNEINIKALGRIHLLPEDVLELVRKVEKKTESYDRFYLNVAVAYGGRAEIVDATRKITEKIQSGGKNKRNDHSLPSAEKLTYPEDKGRHHRQQNRGSNLITHEPNSFQILIYQPFWTRTPQLPVDHHVFV